MYFSSVPFISFRSLSTRLYSTHMMQAYVGVP